MNSEVRPNFDRAELMRHCAVVPSYCHGVSVLAKSSARLTVSLPASHSKSLCAISYSFDAGTSLTVGTV